MHERTDKEKIIDEVAHPVMIAFIIMKDYAGLRKEPFLGPHHFLDTEQIHYPVDNILALLIERTAPLAADASINNGKRGNDRDFFYALTRHHSSTFSPTTGS